MAKIRRVCITDFVNGGATNLWQFETFNLKATCCGCEFYVCLSLAVRSPLDSSRTFLVSNRNFYWTSEATLVTSQPLKTGHFKV